MCVLHTCQVNLTACLSTDPAVRALCGGADASVYLSVEEMVQPQNAYDDFAFIAGRALTKIASFYDISVADCMAVCGAVAIEELSADPITKVPRVQFFRPGSRSNFFPVGRDDKAAPAAPDALPGSKINVADFVKFWKQSGMSTEDGVALMGTHALIDTQACMRGPRRSDYCLPDESFTATCSDVRMFKLDKWVRRRPCYCAIFFHVYILGNRQQQVSCSSTCCVSPNGNRC